MNYLRSWRVVFNVDEPTGYEYERGNKTRTIIVVHKDKDEAIKIAKKRLKEEFNINGRFAYVLGGESEKPIV